MAPQVTRQKPHSPRPRTKLLLVGAAIVAAVAFAAIWTSRTAAIANLDAALPPRPALTGQPAILEKLLIEAEQKAKSPASAIDGIVELARLYHANDFVSEAEACWEFLRKKQPDEARWRYYLADVHRRQGDYAAMTVLLGETLALAPDYAPARLQLANLQFKSGELELAERSYRLRLDALPQDPYARLGLARVALQQERPDAARALLEALLQDTPHFSSAHNLYAELLASDGDDAGARRHRWLGRETLRYREPDDAWLDELQAWCHDYDRLNVLGTIEHQTEQHERAERFFERAIRLDPSRPDAYELLASVYLKRGDVARARDLLESALRQLDGRTSPRVFVSLSVAYRLLEQPGEAVRAAQLGLDQLGPTAELLDALGSAFAALERHQDAINVWQAALAKNPGDAGINYNLARSLLALRQLDDALAALDRSLALQPTYLPTLLLRGEIELQASHLDLAGHYLRPAFEFHPEDAQARRLFAEWHLRRGSEAEADRNPAKAERHYRDGLAVDENHTELLVRLGLFYLLHARPADAIDPLASFHRLQPESAPGCLFLGQAYASTHQREKAREILTTGVQLAERSGNAKIANDCRRLLQQL